VRRLVAASAAGTVEAVGSYTPRSGDGKIRVRSEHFDVAALSAMMYPAAHGQSGFVTLQGDAVVSRTRAAFNGTARATGLTVLGVAAGDVTADIAAGPEGTRASVVAPELSLTGSFGWPASGGAIELDLLLDGMPLERIRPLLPPGTLSGLAGKGSGRVWGTIPTREPRTAELTGRITALTLDAGGMALAIDGESELTLRDGELWLGRTRVRGPQTDLTISGVYDVRTGAAGAGNASGRFDAAFLKLALPELDAQGLVEIDLHANSGDDGLVYGGKVTTTLESLRFPGAPLPLDDLRMSATAAPDGSLDIESVAFNFAGGEVAGTGRGKLRGIELASSELHLHGSNLQMAPLPDLTILFDASLEIVRGAGEATMKGRMDVVRAIYNRS